MTETQTPQTPASGNGPTEKKRKHRRKAPTPAAIVHLDFETGSGFELAQRITTALAASSIVPEAFRGKPGSEGWGNAFIALELAHRLRFPPLLVMQNLTLIDNKPGWQGKFYVALIQAGGQFAAHDWEWCGAEGKDSFGARMFATRLSDGKKCVGQVVTVGMAKAKGWWSKVDRSGIERSHWPSMTAQMLVYRSASFWTNQWNPAATLGLQSVEELLDIRQDEQRLVAPPPPPPVDRLPAAERTLEPGVDPPSMTTTDRSAPATATEPKIHGAKIQDQTEEPEELKLVRKLLADGQRRAAVEAIKKLPAHLQKAGSDIYSAHGP